MGNKDFQMLGREAMRSARPALPRDVVPLPEFGSNAAATLEGLSGIDRDRFEASLLSAPKPNGRKSNALDNVRARLVVLCLIEAETGARIFSDTAEDAAIVGAWPATAVHRMFEKAKELSGMSDAEVEEMGKTYGAALSDS